MAQRRKHGGNRLRTAQGVRPASTTTSSISPPRPSAAAKAKTKKVVTASARKKAPAKKAVVRKKAVAKKAPAKKAAPKSAVKKATAKKPVAKKPAVKKAVAKKSPAQKAPAKKTAAKKAPAKKVAAKQPPAAPAPGKKAATKDAPAKAAQGKKAPAKKVTVKKPPAKPARLVVRADEKPWTAAELAEVRGTLEAERDRLRSEISSAEAELNELLRDSGDGSGDDQADAGSKTFEREHEMSVANNSRDLLMQVEHALARISDGSYGTCESCGQPIGKARLQVFPRATLCVTCKQREERR